MNYSFSHEDDQCARFNYLECECGARVDKDNMLLKDTDYKGNIREQEADPWVSAGHIIQCPECKTMYRCVWGGMYPEKMDNEPTD